MNGVPHFARPPGHERPLPTCRPTPRPWGVHRIRPSGMPASTFGVPAVLPHVESVVDLHRPRVSLLRAKYDRQKLRTDGDDY